MCLQSSPTHVFTSKRRTGGFTLVELLVVVAIIAILIALLLPAVQAARERSRIAQCKNHLRQLGLAAASHLTAHGHFPSGGWGASWTGDPDRGFGIRQPGGWVYNILPYIEEGQTLHALGSGQPVDQKISSCAQAMQSPLALLNCPTRRDSRLYPHAKPYVLHNAELVDSVARTDYAINAGDSGNNSIAKSSGIGGPASLEEGDGNFRWPSNTGYTGVSFLRSKIRAARLTDGLSKTYVFGEKYLDSRHYDTGVITSDRGHLLIGFAPDSVRLAQSSLTPRMDRPGTSNRRFGSAHTSGCNFAFCDGSVRFIGYDIEPSVHAAYGDREDGQ